MLKENQIEDLHLYLNMICDVIILSFSFALPIHDSVNS